MTDDSPALAHDPLADPDGEVCMVVLDEHLCGDSSIDRATFAIAAALDRIPAEAWGKVVQAGVELARGRRAP